MPLADLLIPEFDMECATTRKVLERVPDDRIEWKPHEKAFPMGHLAQLVARLPGWAPLMMARTELDIMPADGPRFPGYSFEKTATLLAEFDKNAAEGRTAIARGTDRDFEVQWTLKKTGAVMMSQPRYHMLRNMVLNHIVHHRAQLGLYLRMVDLKVPMMYGPTADEGK